MRRGTNSRILRVLAAFAVPTLMVGCQIPGGSFGQEPLQTRFAALTKVAIQAEPKPARPDHYTPTPRIAAEPIVLAGHAQSVAGPVATLDRICQPFAAQFGYEPAGSMQNHRARMSAGAAMGWSVTTLERQVFRLPIAVQALLTNAYRRLTGNIIR